MMILAIAAAAGILTGLLIVLAMITLALTVKAAG